MGEIVGIDADREIRAIVVAEIEIGPVAARLDRAHVSLDDDEARTFAFARRSVEAGEIVGLVDGIIRGAPQAALGLTRLILQRQHRCRAGAIVLARVHADQTQAQHLALDPDAPAAFRPHRDVGERRVVP
jgi:hypothetical protein